MLNVRVNISMGPLEERMMLSGMHTVADIFCCCCGQNVGWKYVKPSSLSLSLSSVSLLERTFLSHCCFLVCRNQHTRKLRSIKKANLFLKGKHLFSTSEVLWSSSLDSVTKQSFLQRKDRG